MFVLPYFHVLLMLISVIATNNVEKVPDSKAAQLKEIEELRRELNRAFAEEKKESVVQPSWTHDATILVTENNGKVIVTDERLGEIKKLRDEILEAVKADKYMTAIAATSAGDTKQLSELQKELKERSDKKTTLKIMLATTLKGDDNDDVTVHDDDDDDDDGPNVVESHAFVEPDLDIRKLQSLELKKRRTREVLLLKLIEEDLSFDVGDDVLEWACILHDGKEYFVGRRECDLVIVQKEKLKYEREKILPVGAIISHLASYTFWNAEQRQQEGVILVASGDKVLWYRGNYASHNIEEYWRWTTGRNITSLTYFRIEEREYLVIATNGSSHGVAATLNIYQFQLLSQEFWIVQRLQLAQACADVTILDTGRDIVLAVVQHDAALIFTFNPRAHNAAANDDFVHFRQRERFVSPGIGVVSGFRTGGRSYVALGGRRPQILAYERGAFVPRTIFGQHFGLVEYFLPISVQTYRDDMLLLVQHRVNFETHDVTVLDSLVWDGDAFEATLPAPCRMGRHIEYGVGCILDAQREAGLRGAALVRRDDDIAIIVPRHGAESGLFRLHTELLASNSELFDLREIDAFLRDWVKEQDDLIAQAKAFMRGGDDDDVAPLLQLDLLKAPELIVHGDIDEIYVNHQRWTEADSAVDLPRLIAQIEALGREVLSARQRRDLTTNELNFDFLDFDEVDADELWLDAINGERFYIRDDSLSFDGVLNVENLTVLEEGPTPIAKRLHFDRLETDNELDFAMINGLNWTEIVEGLVFTNVPVTWTNMEHSGEIVVAGDLSIKELNSLSFPQDYLWRDDANRSVVVSAEKVFVGAVVADVLNIEGLVNGIDPQDAITLSQPQSWSGLTTFADLEILQAFDWNETAAAAAAAATGTGSHQWARERYPTLLDSTILDSSCHFEHLEVAGAIVVHDTFKAANLLPLLTDIVQRPANATAEIVILAKKRFSSIVFPVDFRLEQAIINDLPVERFVTRQTAQELTVTTLHGHAYFENLTVGGRYDGIDIVQLLEQSIRTDALQPHRVGAQLNFVHPVVASSVVVRETLNGVALAGGYQRLHDDLVAATINVDVLQAGVADIAGDIRGDARLNGLQLREYLERNTTTPHNVFVDELTLTEGLQSEAVHGIDARFVFDALDRMDEIPQMILDGRVQVDRIHVTGDIHAVRLHGQDFAKDIQPWVVWLDRPNFLSNSLRFMELVTFQEVYCEGTFNGVDFPELVADMVFRPRANESVRLLAPKKFIQDVRVDGDTRLDAINGRAFKKFATKRGVQNIPGDLKINGNLRVAEVKIERSFDGYPILNLTRLIRFDETRAIFVLANVVKFPQRLAVKDLTVEGGLNDLPNVNQFFGDLIYREDLIYLRGRNTFTGRVTIEDGAYIRTFNGFNLLALLDNVVYVNDAQAIVVEAPIIFKAPVRATHVLVAESLQTTNLMGCSVADWLQDTVAVDQNQEILELHFADGVFDTNAFYAEFLNDVDLGAVITRFTAQNLTTGLDFSAVYLDGSITVRGDINDVDLRHEYENTLLIHGDQHVSTPLTMQSCRVLRTLITNAPINDGQDLRDLANIRENLELRSPLFFQNLTVSEVYTRDLVSGIDLDEWYENALWSRGRSQQIITGNWTVRKLIVKNVTDDHLPRLARPKEEDDDDGFSEMCKKVDGLLREHQTSGQRFARYLKKVDNLALNVEEEGLAIRGIFPLMTRDSLVTTLLLNLGCTSRLYHWDELAAVFSQGFSLETGVADQVLQLEPDVVITNGAASGDGLNCARAGLNVWTMRGQRLEHSTSVNVNVSRLHRLRATRDGSFFALDRKEAAVHEYFVVENKLTTPWKLPASSSFHFLAERCGSQISLTDGQQIVDLDLDGRTTLHPVHFRGHTKKLRGPSTMSVLYPNANIVLAQNLSLVDFEEVAERILSDLIDRLRLEIDDVPAEAANQHLAEDFAAILGEMAKQELLAPPTFKGLDVTSLPAPSNAAQILAAQTVQILWPALIDVNEIRHHLDATNPMTECLMATFGALLDDVLRLAYDAEAREQRTTELITQRIEVFETSLRESLKDLRTMIEKRLSHDERPHLLQGSLRDILPVIVGPAPAPRNLSIIVISSSSSDGSMLLLADLRRSDIIQIIANVQGTPPSRSSSFVTMRLHDETLFAFVEDCCRVRVLRYDGIQGFVHFAQFTRTQPVKSLTASRAAGREFLLVNFGQRVDFYEVVMARNGLNTIKMIACD